MVMLGIPKRRGLGVGWGILLVLWIVWWLLISISSVRAAFYPDNNILDCDVIPAIGVFVGDLDTNGLGFRQEDVVGEPAEVIEETIITDYVNKKLGEARRLGRATYVALPPRATLVVGGWFYNFSGQVVPIYGVYIPVYTQVGAPLRLLDISESSIYEGELVYYWGTTRLARAGKFWDISFYKELEHKAYYPGIRVAQARVKEPVKVWIEGQECVNTLQEGSVRDIRVCFKEQVQGSHNLRLEAGGSSIDIELGSGELKCTDLRVPHDVEEVVMHVLDSETECFSSGDTRGDSMDPASKAVFLKRGDGRGPAGWFGIQPALARIAPTGICITRIPYNIRLLLSDCQLKPSVYLRDTNVHVLCTGASAKATARVRGTYNNLSTDTLDLVLQSPNINTSHPNISSPNAIVQDYTSGIKISVPITPPTGEFEIELALSFDFPPVSPEQFYLLYNGRVVSAFSVDACPNQPQTQNPQPNPPTPAPPPPPAYASNPPDLSPHPSFTPPPSLAELPKTHSSNPLTALPSQHSVSANFDLKPSSLSTDGLRKTNRSYTPPTGKNSYPGKLAFNPSPLEFIYIAAVSPSSAHFSKAVTSKPVTLIQYNTVGLTKITKRKMTSLVPTTPAGGYFIWFLLLFVLVPVVRYIIGMRHWRNSTLVMLALSTWLFLGSFRRWHVAIWVWLYIFFWGVVFGVAVYRYFRLKMVHYFSKVTMVVIAVFLGVALALASINYMFGVVLLSSRVMVAALILLITGAYEYVVLYSRRGGVEFLRRGLVTLIMAMLWGTLPFWVEGLIPFLYNNQDMVLLLAIIFTAWILLRFKLITFVEFFRFRSVLEHKED